MPGLPPTPRSVGGIGGVYVIDVANSFLAIAGDLIASGLATSGPVPVVGQQSTIVIAGIGDAIAAAGGEPGSLVTVTFVLPTATGDVVVEGTTSGFVGDVNLDGYDIPAGTYITYQFSPLEINRPGTWVIELKIGDNEILPSVPFDVFDLPPAPRRGFNINAPGFQILDFPNFPPDPQIQLLDDSCTVYTSTDGGDTFTIDTTPAPTLDDNWVDISVPLNDAASPVPNLRALWNEGVNSFYDPTQFDSFRGGVQVIFPGQTTQTAIIRSYSPGVPGDNLWLSATSGAFSSNGTLLAPVSEWDGVGHPAGTIYPRLSRDFGQTWVDVTGLPAGGGPFIQPFLGHPYTRACFAQGTCGNGPNPNQVLTMYIHRYKDFIYKSIDGGTTWNALSNGPTWASNSYGINTPGLDQNSLRLRCSSDSSVIAGLGWDGQFWVSRDGGTTWHHTDFPSLYIPNPTTADFGMAIDGSFFVVAMNFGFNGNFTKAWISTDGITWTDITSRLAYAAAGFGGSIVTTCNCTTDGQTVMMAFDNGFNTTDHQFANIIVLNVSLDRGVTWTLKTTPVNPASGGNNLNGFIF